MLETEGKVQAQEKNNTDQSLFFNEKMASLEQLAAGIAHELRNPLSIIGTSVYYLNKVLENHPNKRITEHLSIMQSEITRSQKMISNLLDFSRRTSTERENVDLNKLIKQTATIIDKNLVYQEIKLETQFDQLPFCFINKDEIKQALLNVFVNAMDAMPNGGKLTVRTYVKDDFYLGMDINDNGIGIAENNMKKIFDPFFSTKQDQNGIGLGLSLVHASIQKNRGKIQIYSKSGEGTTVTIELPIST